MATTEAGWVADGKPAKPAQPIADMIATFQGHGFTCYWYPDQRHLDARPPEDHCPYSNTPWPGAQPYPNVLAFDLMPKAGQDARSLTKIARQMIADKRSGAAPWIKYMNWTDENNKCWHTSWQPNEVTVSSSDTGHNHTSIRTDFVTSTAAKGYDPLKPDQGVDMPEKFLAKDGGGKFFVCDYKDSVPYSAAEADTIAYMASAGGPALAHGSVGAEWTAFAHGQFVRVGWTPAFGKLPQPQTLTLTDAQVKAIADQIIAGLPPGTSLTKADVTQGCLDAFRQGTGTQGASPSMIGDITG